MPQAMERLLATPMIRPRLPRMRPLGSPMTLLAECHGQLRISLRAACFLWHRVRGPSSERGRRPRYCGNMRRCAGVEELRAARVAAGEEGVSAFRSSLQAAIPALRRYARALTRDAEIADDLVQDTLVRALRSEHLFHEGDVRSWP